MILFLRQDTKVKTIYARMFFRRRYWFNKSSLRKYTSNSDHIEASVQALYMNGFIKSDEDAV